MRKEKRNNRNHHYAFFAVRHCVCSCEEDGGKVWEDRHPCQQYVLYCVSVGGINVPACLSEPSWLCTRFTEAVA